MKRLLTFILCFVMLIAVGCTGSIVKIDGKLDPMEAGLVRVGAGGILTANPQYVVPIATITDNLLLDFAFVSPELLDAAVKSEIADYGFTQAELASAYELYDFFKLSIGKEVSFPEIPVSDRMKVLHDILVEINISAKARL